MAVLARPDTVFEANFFDSTDGDNWTDLSAYVELNQGASMSRRRQLIFDEVSAGSFSIYLDNSAGTFNNDRTDLPYAGLIGIDVPVRMRARWPNVPSGTVNMLSDNESAPTDTDFFVAEQGTLDIDDQGITLTNQGTPADHSYFILTTGDAATVLPGSLIQFTSGPAAGPTVYTVTALGAPFAGFVNVSVSPPTTAIPVATNTLVFNDAAVVWSTGVLATTGINLLTGDVPSRSPDDLLPMFVLPNTQYTAGMQVHDDSAGTGISFQVSATILWYDYTGALISESVGTAVTLTTAFQTVSVTATSPANAASARMSLINQTVVNPAVAAFILTGFDGNQVNNGSRQSRLTIPASANVGDLAVAYHRSNKTATFSIPAGWTQQDSFSDGRGTTQVCTKFLTATDIGNPVFWDVGATGINWLSMLATIAGANTAATINGHTTHAESALTATHVTSTVTTTIANALILTFVGDTSSTTSSWSLPAGETLVNQVFGKGGNATTGQLTYKQATTTGTYGGLSVVSNVKSQYSGQSTMAIKPATGTGPGSVNVTAGAWQMVQGSSLGSWVMGGHWKYLFTGLTDSWTKTFAGDLSLMQVSATDASKTLSVNVVQSATFESIMQSGPVAYYMLGESGDSSTTEGANSASYPQDTMQLFQFGTGGTLDWGNGIGPAVDGQAAVMVTKASRTAGAVLRANLTTPIAESDSASISVWFNSSDSDVSGPLDMIKLVNVGNGATEWAFIEIRGTSGTNVLAEAAIISENASYKPTATFTHNIFDGKTHLLTAVAQLTGGTLIITLYVDGVQQASTSLSCPITTFPVLQTLCVANAYPSTNITNGTYSHAAAWNIPLDPDTIADMYVAGTTAYAGDTVDQRIGRIANWAGFDMLTLDDTVTICDRHMPDSQSIISAVQQAARTEGGTSYVADDGSITFKSRANKEDTVTPWLTIDCRYIDPALTEVTDDQLLVNQVVVNRLGANSSTTTQNFISQMLHGVVNKTIDTIMVNPDDAQYCGDYYISFYSTPGQRCDQVVIEAEFLNQWPIVLTQDMWLIIHITNLPSIEHSSTLDLYVEGWQIDMTDESWQLTFDTSSAIPFAVLNDTVRDITGTVVVAW